MSWEKRTTIGGRVGNAHLKDSDSFEYQLEPLREAVDFTLYRVHRLAIEGAVVYGLAADQGHERPRLANVAGGHRKHVLG